MCAAWMCLVTLGNKTKSYEAHVKLLDWQGDSEAVRFECSEEDQSPHCGDLWGGPKIKPLALLPPRMCWLKTGHV